MAAYVACNAKYYKASQWKGLAGHVLRQFEHDENVVTHLSHENFGCQFADLPTLERRMMEAKQAAGLRIRGFQADANVVLDNVLILSAERVEELKAAYSSGYKKAILKAAQELSVRIRDEYGLEPMGIQFHWDEGHMGEDGVFKHNYHAHMQFFNFDFKALNQPLRRMKRGDFSKIQDLAGECYGHLGFERGIPEKTSKNKHLNKSRHVRRELDIEITKKTQNLHSIQERLFFIKNDVEKLKEQEKSLKNSLLDAKSELKSVRDSADHMRSQIVPLAMMGKKLSIHRSDFEEFLTNSHETALVMRLSAAEEALRASGGYLKHPVDDFIELYDSQPNLKKF